MTPAFAGVFVFAVPFQYLFNYCAHNGCTPTDSGDLRGRDGYGSGEFGASRGMRGHAGQDFVASPSEEIVAPISGVARLAYPYPGDTSLTGVAISGRNGEVANVFYVSPYDGIVGSRVSVGQPIGTAQNLQVKYPNGMTNHVHAEIRVQGSSPQPLLNYIQGGR